MFNLFKKKKVAPDTPRQEQKPCSSECFSQLVQEEKAFLDASLDLLISTPDSLGVMGIGMTTLTCERLNADPGVFVNLRDPYYGEGAVHLLFYRCICYLPMYLAGRYAWDTVPSSVQQKHPNYLSDAERLLLRIKITLGLHEKLTNQEDFDKEQYRSMRTIIASILSASSALDDNDFDSLDAELSNTTTEFHQLLNLPMPVLKASVMMMCAVSAATYVIFDRALQYVQDEESRKTVEFRRDLGLKIYTRCRDELNDEYLAPLFYK